MTTLPTVGSNASLDLENSRTTQVTEEQRSNYASVIYQHPDYVAFYEKWKKYEDCYEAEDIYRFLRQHSRESQDIYENRLERGYYLNYCKSVVDLYVAFLYHAPIERQPATQAKEEFEKVMSDANLAGDNYETFIKEVATFGGIYGHCGVLIDSTAAESVHTEQDAKRQNVRVFLRRIKATQIFDWSLDTYGRLNWIKIEVPAPDDRDVFSEVVAQNRCFQIWTKAGWEEWLVDDENQVAEKVREGTHELGEVPFVLFRPNGRRKNHDWFGVSDLEDVADINLAILNWASFGDEEIAERCLNVLAMPDDGTNAAITLSHHNVLKYPDTTQNKPEYLSLNDTPLKLIMDWIKSAKDEIFRLAKLSGSTGLLGAREATSGIAYAYEFNETNQTLSDKAQGMEQGEREVHRIIAKWLGSDEFDGVVDYSDEFGVIDAQMMMTDLSLARTTLTSETAIKEMEKKAVAKMFSRSSTELRDTIRKEIEEAETATAGLTESFDSVDPGLFGESPPTPGGAPPGTSEIDHTSLDLSLDL